jgi:hypothetical protein
MSYRGWARWNFKNSPRVGVEISSSPHKGLINVKNSYVALYYALSRRERWLYAYSQTFLQSTEWRVIYRVNITKFVIALW